VTTRAQDFEFVRKLVRDRSALALDEGKDYLVEARLAPIVRREGLGSLAELTGVLRSGNARLSDDVVDALMTNETSFFRDVHPFEALREHVIPQRGSRPLSIWSAATATGQEAYSIALTVMEQCGAAAGVTIFASDLSCQALDRAKTGRFTQLEVNRGLPAQLLVKYFRREGREWQLDERVRRLVTFSQVNLARDLVGVAPMDVIFLRNVLIYFDSPTKAAVLDRVSRVLRPGGYLFLGSAETTYGIDASYERVQLGRATCYRLTGGGRSEGGDTRDRY